MLSDSAYADLTAPSLAWSRQYSPQLDFRQEIAFYLASVPGVQAIYATDYDRGKVLFVWTVVAERREDLYAQIYRIEQQIIDGHEKVQFDFTVLPSYGKDPRFLVRDPTAELIYLQGS